MFLETPFNSPANWRVMSGRSRSYYRPVEVQQQMVDHRGDKGRGGE